MNITTQAIQNLKSRIAYSSIVPTVCSINTSKNRLRLNTYRDVLNKQIKHVMLVEFKIEGRHYTDDDISFNMIQCPSGSFIMGDQSETNPQRREVIKYPFMLSETEVTRELFRRVMGYYSGEDEGSNQIPAEYCTWYDAVMFCNELSQLLEKKPYYIISNIKREKRHNLSIESADVVINTSANGFRLPTEKEWEYAAKAGTNNKYAGCNTYESLGKHAWFNDNSDNIQPVKTKLPNEWGFYDMSGNVFEWCWGKIDIVKVENEVDEPFKHLSNRTEHLILGGAYDSIDTNEVSKRIGENLSSGPYWDIGFRIALSLGGSVLAKDVDNLSLTKTLFVKEGYSVRRP